MQAAVGSDDPEISVETCWAHLLDEKQPPATCEELGDRGSQYDCHERTGMSGLLLLHEVHARESALLRSLLLLFAFSVHSLFFVLLLLHELLSVGECERLIGAAEQHGFGYTDYPKSYRGNTRLTSVDKSLAEALWERIKPLVPQRLELDDESQWEAIGLNDHWRLAKYVPGDQFKKHNDANYQRCESEVSMYTVNIYANGDFKGGATRFYAAEDHTPGGWGSAPAIEHTVQGKPGLCCVFRQPPACRYMHDGEAVEAGVKYLIRSDVMYRRVDG